jgi:hypothetical protein
MFIHSAKKGKPPKTGFVPPSPNPKQNYPTKARTGCRILPRLKWLLFEIDEFEAVEELVWVHEGGGGAHDSGEDGYL